MNLLGILAVAGLAAYAVFLVFRRSAGEAAEGRRVKLKAAIFYGLVIGGMVACFVINILFGSGPYG